MLIISVNYTLYQVFIFISFSVFLSSLIFSFSLIFFSFSFNFGDNCFLTNVDKDLILICHLSSSNNFFENPYNLGLIFLSQPLCGLISLAIATAVSKSLVDESLNKLKIAWNKRHPDQKINDTKPRLIWKHLKEYMRNACNRESCWLKQETIKSGIDKNIMDYTFAPETPAIWKEEPNKWLNSVDIGKVMKQYENKYNNFQFIGPSPINWDSKEDNICILPELCDFDLINYLKSREIHGR